MLAKHAEKPFNSEEWIFEVKWDGYRAIAEIDNKMVRLYSRNNKTLNDKFPAIVEELKGYSGRMVLDGLLSDVRWNPNAKSLRISWP